MNAPIIDPSTLIEEQRNKIYTLYSYAEEDLESDNELIQNVGYGRKTLLDVLFSREFFEKGE